MEEKVLDVRGTSFQRKMLIASILFSRILFCQVDARERNENFKHVHVWSIEIACSVRIIDEFRWARSGVANRGAFHDFW